MSMPVPVVWSADCLRHEPAGEVWLGLRDPGTELPDRALVLRAALEGAGAPVQVPARTTTRSCAPCTTPRLVNHLAGIWADWDQAGLPADHGRDRVVPYLFPTGAMLAGLPLRVPPAAHARAGLFCYDTMTLLGPGSWEAIRGAVDAALTAADLVSSGSRAGLRAVPAARAPCHPRRLRRLLLPEQRRGRRPGAAHGRRGRRWRCWTSTRTTATARR